MSFGNDDSQLTSVTGGIFDGAARPYIKDIMSEAARLYGSDVR